MASQSELQIWEQSVESAERQIKIATGLVATGMRILQKASLLDGDPGSAKTLLDAATAVEKATRMERDARRNLMLLHQRKPRVTTK